jgi:hypothetical protein
VIIPFRATSQVVAGLSRPKCSTLCTWTATTRTRR